MRRLTTYVILLLLVASCASVGPDYARPAVDEERAWATATASTSQATAEDDARLALWWSAFSDTTLTSLIERALNANLDLKSAVSKLRESRARIGMSRAGYYPTLDASASAGRSKSSADFGGGSSSDTYGLSLDAGWELDFFGGTRRSVEAAYADMQSYEEAMRGVRVSLASEVALSYISLRAYQHRIAKSEASIEALESELQMTSARREAGMASELERVEAEETLYEARSRMPSLQAGQDESMNRLCVLLGLAPGALDGELRSIAPLPGASGDISAGLPADLIRRRPDVRQAERRLAAETARIGVATAELYPKLTIGGSIGFKAATSGALLDSGNDTYSIGPSITVPLFRGGYLRRNIEAQGEVREQAMIAYESAVLGALEESENAFSSHARAREQAEHLRMALDSTARSERITRALFDSGLRDYRTYLDITMKRISMEDALILAEADASAKLVGLYKALGGGWDASETMKEIPTDGEK